LEPVRKFIFCSSSHAKQPNMATLNDEHCSFCQFHFGVSVAPQRSS
jgi:hypothetical protein